MSDTPLPPFEWRSQIVRVSDARLIEFAAGLGVSMHSLRRLKTGWCPQYGAWAFPMRDAGYTIKGFRLRKDDGSKFALTGSRNMLFLPLGLQRSGRLLVCEGPTDCAALLDMGYDVIGRPSANAGSIEVALFIMLWFWRTPTEVVLFIDRDENNDATKDFAEKLAKDLLWAKFKVKIVRPPQPFKDAREWINSGISRRSVDGLIQNVVEYEQPKKIVGDPSVQVTTNTRGEQKAGAVTGFTVHDSE